MKKLLAVILLAITAISLSGCGTPAKRVLYNVNLTKYVKVGDYKGIKVDTSSDDFKKVYDSVLSSDVEQNDLYVKKTEGTVADGDKVNIDYTGRKDGVAFEGGADTGFDLTIGSNSFIDGFETGLIGAAIGSTVDLNLTFPESYGNTELAGKAVVFTVKINYVTTTDPLDIADYIELLEFDSEKEYTDDVTMRAVKNFLISSVCASSKVSDYPSEDTELLYQSVKENYELQCQNQYGVDLATVLKAQNQTEEQFKSDLITNNLKPEMDKQMVLYSIMDKEKLTVSDKDTEAKVNEIVKQNEGADAESVKKYFGDYYFEYMAVTDKVTDFLYENADIK